MKTPASCIECDDGILHTIVEDYEIVTPDGNRITVPQVELVRCDHCGETLIPAASSRQISDFQARSSEQLSQEELHSIFERLDLTQKDFAEALGLGEKTLHRWLKGTQIVSRSMGYYLRAMAHFPQAFEWVKDRQWRQKETEDLAPVQRHQAGVFEALERRTSTYSVLVIESNPAQGLVRDAIQHCR